MEVLDSLHEVLAVDDWDGSLSIFISANLSPDLSQEKLFFLLGNSTDESELEEDLGHLLTVDVSEVLRGDIKFSAGIVKIIVESVMEDLVRLWIDLAVSGLVLQLQLLLELILLDHVLLSVSEDILHPSVHLLGLLVDLWSILEWSGLLIEDLLHSLSLLLNSVGL